MDAQVHLGALGGTFEPPCTTLSVASRRGRWLAGHPLPDASALLREMDRVGVDAAVLVPLTAAMTDPFNADEPCRLAARRHPDRFRVMARVDPGEPAHEPALDRWHACPEVLGVRVSFAPGRSRQHPPGTAPVGGAVQPADPGVRWLWEALVARGMPVMVNAPGSMAAVGEVARLHPDLRIVVDHLGFAGMYQDDLHDDLGQLLAPLLALAQHPNVAVKASGLPAVVTEAFPYPRLQQALRSVIDSFGAHRVFWGSNISRLPCPYEHVVGLFRDGLPYLSDDARRDILGAGILRWLSWRGSEVQS